MIRLTNEQWERIRNHFPEEHIPDGRPGRRPISTRRVFEAVLWILNTGAQWHMLPQSYPNYKSVHRRFQTWCRDEVLRRVLMDGSSWIAALGQHACRQSPRSSAGTAMLRLLHDRGQAGEFDRRSRLRQRSTRRGVAQGRHRDDRAASQQQKQAAHARSATAKPLYATLARGALLCLDSMAAPHPRPLGILRPELPRLRTARLPHCPLQAILR